MHLQQTKADSRASGGPQYYFHDLPAMVKDFLRRRGACPVVLQTPYGIAASSFMAVGRDHKLTAGGKIVAGKVGHDRVQQASGSQSIGEAIRHWYGLAKGRDFWRIQVEVIIRQDGPFILVPTSVWMDGAKRERAIEKLPSPLSFHRDHQSKLWRTQIQDRARENVNEVSWAASQIRRIVNEHHDTLATHILESDLLRAAGALSVLGLELSPYLGKGYDCAASRFHFSHLPSYPCPVEIKKKSSGFNYQITKYTHLPRAVILCMKHDLLNPPEHVDVLELTALSKHLSP